MFFRASSKPVEELFRETAAAIAKAPRPPDMTSVEYDYECGRITKAEYDKEAKKAQAAGKKISEACTPMTELFEKRDEALVVYLQSYVPLFEKIAEFRHQFDAIPSRTDDAKLGFHAALASDLYNVMRAYLDGGRMQSVEWFVRWFHDCTARFDAKAFARVSA